MLSLLATEKPRSPRLTPGHLLDVVKKYNELSYQPKSRLLKVGIQHSELDHSLLWGLFSALQDV